MDPRPGPRTHMLCKHLAKFPPLDSYEVDVIHYFVENFTPAVVYFGEAKPFNPFLYKFYCLGSITF